MTATAGTGQPGRFGNDAATGLIFVELLGRVREPLASTQIAGNFQTLPDAADDAIAEPESARSAGHQPVHPAARAIRRRRAAAQDQRSAGHAGIAAADRAIDPGAGIRRQDRGGQWQHRRPDQQLGDLESRASRRIPTSTSRSPTAPGRPSSPAATPSAPATTSPSPGTARAMTARSGRTASTPDRDRRPTARATPSPLPPRSRAWSVRSISPSRRRYCRSTARPTRSTRSRASSSSRRAPAAATSSVHLQPASARRLPRRRADGFWRHFQGDLH